MINSSIKGRRGERELARILRAAGFTGTQRTIQGRGGAEAPDLSGLPWRVEVKLGSKAYVQPLAALEQCERDAALAGDTRPCLAITRVDRGQWLVTARLVHLWAALGWGQAIVIAPVVQTSREHDPRHLVVTCALADFLARVRVSLPPAPNDAGPK